MRVRARRGASPTPSTAGAGRVGADPAKVESVGVPARGDGAARGHFAVAVVADGDFQCSQLLGVQQTRASTEQRAIVDHAAEHLGGALAVVAVGVLVFPAAVVQRGEHRHGERVCGRLVPADGRAVAHDPKPVLRAMVAVGLNRQALFAEQHGSLDQRGLFIGELHGWVAP